MSHGVDARGRVIMTKAVGPNAAGNAEHAGAVMAVMLVDDQGMPVTFSGGGGTGTQTTYVHTQDAVSDTWVINHKLSRFPSVTVVDSAGTQGIPDVDYHLTEPDLVGNTITCTFSSAFSGKAFLN